MARPWWTWRCMQTRVASTTRAEANLDVAVGGRVEHDECFIQRYGGALNANVQGHVVMPDAVFVLRRFADRL